MNRLLQWSPMVLVWVVSLGWSVASADPWNAVNHPDNMNPAYDHRFDFLPLKGGVDDAHMPWSDNYWESDWGGIAIRWKNIPEAQLDPSGTEVLDKYAQFKYNPPTLEQLKRMSRDEIAALSPAEKFDIYLGNYGYPTFKGERARTNPEMKPWEGICHGWVPAAINHPEPLPVDVVNKEGLMIPFGSSDVKGLLSFYYGVPAYDYARGNRWLLRHQTQLFYWDQVDGYDLGKWIPLASLAGVFANGYEADLDQMSDGAFCEQPQYAAQYGTRESCLLKHSVRGYVQASNKVGQVGLRPTKRELFGVKGLTDPNPGAFHIVMANQLGLMKRAFAGNINKKIKNAEIWNQPLVAYETKILEDRRGRKGGKVEVRTVLTYVNEIAQHWEPVVGTPKQRLTKMEFDYTLDIDSFGRITGGEWENRKKHPSFIWKHDAIEIRGYFGRLNEIYRARF
jgi:hypothetical protein